MYIGIIIIVLGIILDQITKIIAKKTLENKKSRKVLNLNFAYLENSGFAMGKFSGRLWLMIISTTLALVICAFGFYYYDLVNNTIYSVGLCLFMGGSIGNFIDRIFRGYVIDFFYFNFKNKYTPVFNIADFLIFIGLIFVVISYIFL